jgi:hypothetical protein
MSDTSVDVKDVFGGLDEAAAGVEDEAVAVWLRAMAGPAAEILRRPDQAEGRA